MKRCVEEHQRLGGSFDACAHCDIVQYHGEFCDIGDQSFMRKSQHSNAVSAKQVVDVCWSCEWDAMNSLPNYCGLLKTTANFCRHVSTNLD